MKLLNLDEVIDKGVFEIPNYQRGYAWQERQLKDFWNDLEYISKLENKFHYMHNLTLRLMREAEDELDLPDFEVVDGQQRLTTSLMLLGLLARVTKNEDKHSLKSLKPTLYYSYNYYDVDDAFEAIVKEEKDLEKFKTSFYAKNFINAYEFFEEKISNTPMDTLNRMFDALTKRMLFSVVELNDSRIDKFSSFETINNRGKELSTLELLKNRLHFIAHKICDGDKLEELQDFINSTYTSLYDSLKNFQDSHLESFLKHFVAYYYGEKGNFKARLLDMEFNAHKRYTHNTNLDDEYEKIEDLLLFIKYSSWVWDFLHTLDEENIIISYTDDNGDEKELKIEITPKMLVLLDKMRRLNALSDNAFMPLLLSIFTTQILLKFIDKQPYTTKELEDLLGNLERFGFLVYGVASRDTAKDKLINLAFKNIQAYRWLEVDKVSIEELPTLIEGFFKGQHSGLELLEERINLKTKPKKWYEWGKALNYLLYEYELHHNPTTSLDFSESAESIEHILPQTPDKGYSTKEKNLAKKPNVVHALGNLLLLPKNANSSLSNKPFDEKIKEYQKGSYSEKEVAKNTSWGVTEIKERSEKLLDFLIQHWNIAELVSENEIKEFKNSLLKEIK
ncbi:DUF262 domain-containing protein [Helicobacter cetorum]|uniref:DUF262 domain-containing protein n=1 Tax=Helicobacter cetorum (strain ATCC BAA-429 / MIT 00-7128) TaxID=182217 RepID=I0EKR5_HELC0|nr:DUF262 domain-containing protein [Helicobacter cetorum]AFI03534.1 hypothetical protein HCW_01215 [Helicobacter cetorum MIT 00-7128]